MRPKPPLPPLSLPPAEHPRLRPAGAKRGARGGGRGVHRVRGKSRALRPCIIIYYKNKMRMGKRPCGTSESEHKKFASKTQNDANSMHPKKIMDRHAERERERKREGGGGGRESE